LREGKKIAIVRGTKNKKLIGNAMNINSKNVYSLSKKETKDLQVKKDIEEVFKTHPAYGHRRLAIELGMNKKKVRRIMKKYHLKPPRLWYQKRFTTKANNKFKDQFGNLIKNIKTPKENEIWASDLTYMKFQDKFIYLSAVQDISTKEVVSCDLGDKHNSDLVLKTIKEAIKRYGKLPKIFHSDRGTEFLNEVCIKFFKENHIQISVSDPGSPWQNGHSESFFSRFKAETGDLNRFESLGELTEYIYQFINYYNNERIITRLKTSPIKYKQSLRNCS
jgi:putative transposase